MTEFIKSSIRSSFLLWISVIKLMIPIAISVKLLDEVGGIHFIGTLLEPIMISVGLPGIMGLVWAVTMFTNLWTGALLFVTLIGNVEVTSAQVTILGIMMLISHGLPLEIRMVQKCGVSAIFSLILRLSGSLILAYLFNFAFNTFNLLNEPALVMIGEASSLQESFSSWCVSQLKSYILVYFMLVGLVLTLDLLKKFNLVHKLGKILSPYFSLIGVSKNCAPITFVGMTLGLVYGGALLLEEVEKGELDEDDVLLSVTSMNLFHSIIEDTIIIFMMGGALFWILVVRFIYTAIVMKLISILIKLNEQAVWKIIKN